MSDRPVRVNVTVPAELWPMLEWLKEYGGERFGRSYSAVLAELAKVGAELVYAEGLKNATPLDSEVEQAVAEVSRGSLNRALMGE